VNTFSRNTQSPDSGDRFWLAELIRKEFFGSGGKRSKVVRGGEEKGAV